MITLTDIGYNGRLGNQLFNYALLYKFKLMGKEVFIPKFNTQYIKDDGTLDRYHNQWIKYRCVLYDYFNLSIPLREKFDDLPMWTEPKVQFYPEVLQMDNVNFRGYFQSWKYFDDIRAELLKEFKFKDEIIERNNSLYNKYSNKKIIGIHIRLGDTLAQPNMHKLSPEYITEVFRLLPEDDYNIMVFSDNIEYCKEWFPDDDSIYFENGLTEIDSLYLLTLVDHLILSGSTFSWWAAYLNKKDGMKIFPNHFDATDRDLDGFYHPSWKRIDTIF